MAASDIEQLWLAQRDACKPPICQLISADYSEPEEDVDSATVAMLISANHADALIDGLRKLGRITRHDIAGVDRTLQVVDLSARLANQRALRDRLRTLASQRADKLRDVLDLERELARVQGNRFAGWSTAASGERDPKRHSDHAICKPASAMHDSAWVPATGCRGEGEHDLHPEHCQPAPFRSHHITLVTGSLALGVVDCTPVASAPWRLSGPLRWWFCPKPRKGKSSKILYVLISQLRSHSTNLIPAEISRFWAYTL